jgi:hypothetical protein
LSTTKSQHLSGARNLKVQKILRCFVVACSLCTTASLSFAMDLTNGSMMAVPVPGGKAPTIDGDLKEWDLSASEPIWVAPETARQFHATVALMQDADALYIGARVSLPGRPLNNPNTPADAFWNGDVLEFHLAANPALPSPLTGDATVKASNRIAHLTMWKNTETEQDYLLLLNLDTGLVASICHVIPHNIKRDKKGGCPRC